MKRNHASLGGTIQCMGSNLDVQNSRFETNTANRDGGVSGMLCKSIIYNHIPGKLKHMMVFLWLVMDMMILLINQFKFGVFSTIGGGKAFTAGGAITCRSCTSTIEHYNTSFLSNTASLGGALALLTLHHIQRAHRNGC